ncbi:unnamed protein product [Schistosoma rodhaini]|uniref:Uncharacterized protein n=1 Tax=Schistosoma rodhaini TaxID=6188 RepID=A0AA85GCJ4_9TREM|nr:unnamed protein product [Schistosoma rodhaini]
MNTVTLGLFCIVICLIEINAGAVLTVKPQTVTVKPQTVNKKNTTPVHQEQPSFWRRMWNSVTSMFGSSDSSSETKTKDNNNPNPSTAVAESLSLKERIMNKFNSIFGEEEYNPPQNSDFTERLWMLFKHCFLNFKNLAKIFSI